MRSIIIPAVFASVVASLVASLTACPAAHIPGTEIDDTRENREVLAFLTRYQQAIAQRSAAGVVALCAKEYFEDNGTADANDDYGLEQLKARLDDDLKKTKEIHLDVIVQRIERTGDDKAPVNVIYRFNQRALLNLPAGDKWVTFSDVNRLVLRPLGDGHFEILSGL